MLRGGGGQVPIFQGYDWGTEGQIITKHVHNVKNLTSNLKQGIYSLYKLKRRRSIIDLQTANCVVEWMSLVTLKVGKRSSVRAHYDMCMISDLVCRQRSWKRYMTQNKICKYEMKRCCASKVKWNAEHNTHVLSVDYLKTTIVTHNADL
jgi:hypothetical protein